MCTFTKFLEIQKIRMFVFVTHKYAMPPPIYFIFKFRDLVNP